MAYAFQPRGLFGRKPMFPGMPGPISGFGGGTFNMDGTQATPVDGYPDAPMDMPQEAMQAAPKPGMFGKITGAMGDIGSILDDEPSPAEIENQRQRFIAEQSKARALAEQQQAEAGRSQDWADYVRKQEYEAAHPRPEAPDAFERALRGAGIDPASEQGRELYKGRAESMARDPNDEFVVVPIPGVGTYAGPRSGLAEAMGGAPQRKLGPVVDAIPGGPGATPGTFPGRY